MTGFPAIHQPCWAVHRGDIAIGGRVSIPLKIRRQLVTLALVLATPCKALRTYRIYDLFIMCANGPVQSRHAHLSGVQSLKNYEEERIVMECALCERERKTASSFFLK